jgi:putative heme-binding domain-containing protein
MLLDHPLPRTAATLTAGLTALFLLPAAPAHAQRDAKIPDPDPEIERRSFQVAEGFEVNLFAADPLLAKPIQMNFDSAGRLWIACSEVYPQILPGQKANDKIVVLEVRTGTGRADKVTVFADGLLIPTGIEPGDGGVYVADSTDLVHLMDTKGTGKADRRRVVLSGFGTEDTHHILHTLRWGPEGMLYFNQSVYIHSHIETPHGVRRLDAGGIWQFRPETMQLEVFVRGFINPWGHHFDRWGQSFATDGAFGEGINYLVPGAYYITAKGATRILGGLNPGSPKHCGLEILSGRHLPPDWQGNMLTNDFRGHRVCRFIAREDGSGYVSQEQPELIKTNHAAFRPVDIKMGPDGAIYIADWYNPIIQHGEVDFRDPRRDHAHGRIWRVTAKGRPLVARPELVGAPTARLLEALKAPEDWTRHHAKRMLKERGQKVVPELAAWVKQLDPADAAYEHHLLEALWTYQALNVPETQLLDKLLHARDHHVRAAATRVISHWKAQLPRPKLLLAGRVEDDHPQVRLEAVRGLAHMGDAHSVAVAMQVLDRPMDKYLEYGAWLTARETAPIWLPAFQAGDLPFHDNHTHLVFALEAAGSRNTVPALVALLRVGKISQGEQEANVLSILARLGGPEELGLVLDRIVAPGIPESNKEHLLLALERAASERGLRPAGDLNRLAPLLGARYEHLRAAAARVAGLWKLESLRPQLLAAAQQNEGRDVVRDAAMKGLAFLGGPASVRVLEELTDKAHPLKIRRMAVVALAAVDLQAAARRAAEVLAAHPDESDTARIYEAFVQRKNGPESLAAALAGRKLPGEVAKLGMRAVRLSGRDFPVLASALTKAGDITAGPRQLRPEQMKQMVDDVLQNGDAARGEALFRRKDLACLKCHAIAGAGGQVGPDLVSIGASAPIDYLVESVLEPNKAIKEGYHSLVVATREGRLFTGIKVRETKTELVLRDSEDREITIPTNSIEERANGKSLMPDGLADTLTHRDFVDLVRFLSELGKIGPYAVSKAAVVRRWQVLEPTKEAHQVLARNSLAALVAKPSLAWSPAYSTVSGTLPLDAAPVLELKGGFGEPPCFSLARCQVEVTTPGKVKLLVDSVAGLSLWVDGVPAEVKEATVLEMKSGVHTLTFGIDLKWRTNGLRCEVEEMAGSPARVRPVGGK